MTGILRLPALQELSLLVDVLKRLVLVFLSDLELFRAQHRVELLDGRQFDVHVAVLARFDGEGGDVDFVVVAALAGVLAFELVVALVVWAADPEFVGLVVVADKTVG